MEPIGGIERTSPIEIIIAYDYLNQPCSCVELEQHKEPYILRREGIFVRNRFNVHMRYEIVFEVVLNELYLMVRDREDW